MDKGVFKISRSVKLFFKSSFYTAIAIVIIFVLLGIPKLSVFNPSESSFPSSSSAFEYIPKKDDRFSLLVTLRKEEKSSPYAYFLLDFNAANERISVCRLFPQTVLSRDGEKRILLNECFDKSKAAGALGALNSYFDCEITRYINFTNDTLISFFDLFEPTVLDVPQNLSQYDKKNDIYIKIDKGRQALSSVLLVDYIACTLWQKGNEQILYEGANAIGSFIRQHHQKLSLALDSEAENYILANTDTNISVTDIEKKRECVKYLLFESKDNIFPLALDGNFKNEKTEFHLNSDSYNKIFSHFAK